MNILITLLAVFRVAFVGDPQVDNETELVYARRSIYAELRARKDLDLVVVLGDIVNENPSLIVPSEASLDSLRCSWVRLHGNHDGPDPVPDTTFVAGGVRFILMNNVRLKRGRDYEGGFLESQKRWLSGVVGSCSPSERIVLCTHIPLTHSKGLDSLSAVLHGRNDLLLVCGHTHQVDRRSTPFGEQLTVGAACGSWWRGLKDGSGIPYALQNCGSPKGWFIADFAPSRQQWYSLRYKCVGRPAPEQCSVRLDNNLMVINIFGGSVDGRVSVRIGGRWHAAARSSRVAPEVLDVIEFNRSMTRDYRKAHKADFIPLRTVKSPHIWALDLADDPSALAALRARPIRIRYRDPSMRFSTRVPIR